MSNALEDFPNSSPGTIQLGNVKDFLCDADAMSPIDQFYTSLGEILRCGNVDLLNEHIILGGYLLVGCVAATEFFSRSMLAAIISECPIAKECCSEKSINLGAVAWQGKAGYARSAFDHLSLADPDELRKAYRGFVGFELKDASFRDILVEYGRVCQLRHAIAHANGFLPGRNAVKLGVPARATPARLRIGYAELQDCAAVCASLVAGLNRSLFREMCTRWGLTWRRRPDWSPTDADRLFTILWRLFNSQIDRQRRVGRSRFTKSRCKAVIVSLYGL